MTGITLRTVLGITGFAVLLAGAVLHLPMPLNHDAAWHLQTAFKWLDGDAVGYGVIDINPPMTMWISSIPASIIKIFNADPAVIFKIFVLLVMGCVYLICLRLKRLIDWTSAQQVYFFSFLAIGVFLLPGYDFGQREHLAAALILPYVLIAELRLRDVAGLGRIALLSGLIAGAGIGIKPYFVAVLFCIEFTLIFYLRSWRQFMRLEFLTVVAIGVIYTISIMLFAPGYFLETIPAALTNYRGFDSPLLLIGERIFSELAFVGLVIVVLVAAGARQWRSSMFVLLISTATGFLIAVIAQQKGWFYQVYPVKFYLLLAVGILIGEMHLNGKFKNSALIAGILIGVVITAKPLIAFLSDMNGQNSTKARIDRLAEVFSCEAGAGGKVFGFITSPRDVHPALLQSGTKWSGASGVLVFLPAYLRQNNHGSETDDVGDITENSIYKTTVKYDQLMIDGLEAGMPKVVVSQFGPGRLGLEDVLLSYPDYFARYPRFAAFWKHYRYSETIGSFKVYLRQSKVESKCGA